MKNIQVNKFNTILLLSLMLTLIMGCEREISEDAVPATFSNNPNIFTDNPVGLTDEFFESFDPVGGANVNGFGVDNNEAYEGTTSIRIDVPAPNDPDGGFIGGIFRDRGAGRDLSQYDALTFWAKASTTGDLGEAGFGSDFLGDKFRTVAQNIPLSTDWKKYIIPIPDASKLVQERGLFVFAAGTQSTNGFGFTIWIDELKFETLGTIAQPRPVILGGQDIVQNSFTGSVIPLSGFTHTVNLPSGSDMTVIAAPAYFSFESTDNTVATVSEIGQVTINGAGMATITASIDGVLASGSLEVSSSGPLPSATPPTLPQSNVKSIFSDAYTNDTSSDFAPAFGGSTTETSIVTSNNDAVLIYTNNNFTGIIFDNTVDATDLTFMHVDIYAQQPGVSVQFQIRDIGDNGEINTNIFTGQPEGDDRDFRFTASNLTVNEWNSFEIPLVGGILNQKDNLGAIILANGPNFILDNIYFYTE